MTKSELKDRIKGIIKQVYKPSKTIKIDLDSESGSISLDAEKFPILSKFPTLKKTLIDLLTDQYELFVQDIFWIAPKPSTFKIVLLNNQQFTLTYTEKSWRAHVLGKKYYLLNLSEEERATEAISKILSYSYTGEETSLPEKGETPEEETPTEETPEEIPPQA
jgi:hypothetical protein